MIHIRRSQWNGRIGTTKTKRVRSVPLVPELAEVIRAHRQCMLEEQHPGVASGLVFPSLVGGLMHRSAMRKPLLRSLKATGLKVQLTTHGLRRTFNNLVA